MRWELIRWELKKLCTVPMFAVFLLLCLGVNSFLILGNRVGNDGGSYVDYVAAVTGEIGGQMGREFDGALAQSKATAYRETLISETYGATDILERYDTSQIYEYYTSLYQISGSAAQRLERKYEWLQGSADQLAARDASLSLSAAGMTKPLLDSLFKVLCRMVITQGMILGVMMALHSYGYEGLSRTEAGVYASRTGRAVQKSKLAASAIGALAAYALLAAGSLLVFVLAWNLGPIWSASMSSQFYYVRATGVVFPFLTWSHFTVGAYLGATLLLGGAMVLIFHLLGFGAGLIMGNTYYGFVLCFLFVVLEFGALMVCGNGGFWSLYQIIQWTPIALWCGQNLWFTGLEFGPTVPYQECLAALVCLIALGLLVFVLYRRMLKKDVKEVAA